MIRFIMRAPALSAVLRLRDSDAPLRSQMALAQPEDHDLSAFVLL